MQRVRVSVDTNTPIEDGDIPQLRFLRVLVTVLAGVMIVGLLVLISLIVISFRADQPQFPTLPDTITLPKDARPMSVTGGTGWFLVVTEDGRALVYTAGGTLKSETRLSLPE